MTLGKAIKMAVAKKTAKKTAKKSVDTLDIDQTSAVNSAMRELFV